MRPTASGGAIVAPYPKLLPFEGTPEVRGLLCYVLEHYGDVGLTVAVDRRKAAGDVELYIHYADWAGNKVDVADDSQPAMAARFFHERRLATFVDIMRTIGIQSASFHLAVGSDDLVLTDISLGPVKMTSPGMVKDIFGRIVPTQKVAKVELIDERAVDAIERGFGSYVGDLILKPSRFRTVERDGGTTPLYVQVRR